MTRAFFRHPTSYGFGNNWVFEVSSWYTLQHGRTEMFVNKDFYKTSHNIRHFVAC